MAELTHADLHGIVKQINDTIRHEVQLARQEHASNIQGVNRRLDEAIADHKDMRSRADAHDRELGILSQLAKTQDSSIDELHIETQRHGERLAALEAMNARRRQSVHDSAIAMTRKQKAALSALILAALTAFIEFARYVWSMS